MTDVPRVTTRVLAGVWPACTGALAVLCAGLGDGAWARRSAIAWMMGSWGARLTAQALYARGIEPPLPVPASFVTLPISALFFSLPALIATRNLDPSLSSVEIAASLLWMVAFAAETTADRQRIRFAAKPEHAGLICRSGIWRVLPHAHAVCEALIWTAFALFAFASPWGWIAVACPVAMTYVQLRSIVNQSGVT